ncbi:hypothetical protein K7G98_37560, partial [Saccharothrix sp. MB29]|nr:hypothetical protein [Saccharothrix sp. MB29]
MRRLRLLAEVLRRGLDADSYRRLVRADAREVKRWTAQVTLFLPSTSPTGQPLPPLHPVTGAVLEELSDGHLTELARAISLRLPEGSEEILVEAARSVEREARWIRS